MREKIALLRWCAVLLTSFLLFACVERERSNPFEPGNQTSPLDLVIYPAMDHIELSWSLSREFLDLQGFRIYRALNNPDQFEPVSTVPANQFSWQDTSIQTGNWYYYRVTALGVGIESPASPVLKSYPGPGNIWVLSSSDQCLKRLSYDLITQFDEIVTVLPAISWTNRRSSPITWLTAAQFDRGLMRVNRDSLSEDFLRVSSFLSPVDICQHPLTGELYVLDSEAGRIFFFDTNGNLLRERPLPEDEEYLKISFLPNPPRLMVLSRAAFRIYPANSNGNLQYGLSFPGGFIGQDMDALGNRVFILAANFSEGRSHIYRWEGNQADTLRLSEPYYLLRSDSLGNRLWVAWENPTDDDIVVQLSLDGDRQNTLQGQQFGFVSDLAINPYDGSITLVDLTENILYLFGPDGRLISEARNARDKKYIFQPLRVFIE